MQNPGDPGGDSRPAGRLDGHELAGRGVGKPCEDARCVRSAPGTSHHHIRVRTVEQDPALLACLLADHALKLAHHPRIRVRSHDRAQAVVGVIHRGHPGPQRLIHGILEGATSCSHRHDGCTQQLHSEHVELLALGVHLAHVDDALHPEQGSSGGGSHPVLAGTGLGDQLPLPHAASQQALSDDVVELVRTRVGQVFALEEQPDAELLGQPTALGDRRGPSAVVPEDAVELGSERRVCPCITKGRLEFDARRNQRFGHIASSELAEAACRPRVAHEGSGGCRISGHRHVLAVLRSTGVGAPSGLMEYSEPTRFWPSWF